MKKLLQQEIWHELFEAGVFVKAFNSVWELLGGIFLLTRLHTWLARLFIFVGNSELLGGRDDFFSRITNSQVHHLSVTSTRTFVGLYLLFHGIMNAFLAYNLYKNRIWAYPTMLVFVSIFFVYQLYRLAHTHSPVLLAVSIFDIFFLVLTWHEWRYQSRRRKN